MTIKLELTRGCYTYFDDEDWEKVSQHNWYIYGKIGNYAWVRTMINMKRVNLQNFILNLNSPNLMVDHINHDPLDNRKCNLRICTKKQNNQNSKKPKNNTSGYKGVSYSKRKRKFYSHIGSNNKRIFLGFYNDPIVAAKVYDKKAKELFGEFACINFPNETFVVPEIDESTVILKRKSHLDSNNISGYRGVSIYNRNTNPFVSKIKHMGETLHLGCFDNILIAALKRDEASIKYHKSKAKLNFPMYINACYLTKDDIESIHLEKVIN